ncbi:E3 ubiquitin protein ligase RIE1-like [Aristolochia californica]|uniref:E3 ubiquitin protein ligase RIE1-like n=1 Tax=Aristolochia californica TaxID=171875 RepID=UPI0035D622F3
MEDDEPTSGGPLLHPRSPPSPCSPLSLLLSRRIMRDSSSRIVRETAAFQLEERHTDWGYSRPVVVLDLVWNLAFVIVSSVVLLTTFRERPSAPLRVWVAGYALQCLLHVGFVFLEYRRRVAAVRRQDNATPYGGSSFAKRLESTNTMVSFLWWIVGFYWIVVGGQALLQDAPRLYWLTVVFLAFDVFFAIFCILLACIIGIALCCCLPCIIAFLYAVAGQEGASEADISVLPKFRYRRVSPLEENFDLNGQQGVPVLPRQHRVGGSTDEVALSPDDSECCICLTQYEDGVELHSLPCNHHFHSGCIIKWLRINATCPLCKYNILRGGDEQV